MRDSPGRGALKVYEYSMFTWAAASGFRMRSTKAPGSSGTVTSSTVAMEQVMPASRMACTACSGSSTSRCTMPNSDASTMLCARRFTCASARTFKRYRSRPGAFSKKADTWRVLMRCSL